MMWSVCFAASVLVALISVIYFINQKHTGGAKLEYLGAGVFLACLFVCWPAKFETCEDALGLGWKCIYTILMCLSHSLRMFVVDTGIDDLADVINVEMLGNLGYQLYRLWISLLYVIAPVFTLSIVLTQFSNIFERIRLSVHRNIPLYVFSDLNDRALTVAESVWKLEKKAGNEIQLVFCKSDSNDDVNNELEEKARDMGAIFISKEIDVLKIEKRKGKVVFFTIAMDEDLNLNTTISLLEKIPANVNNTSIYCYTSNSEAEILLDAMDKKNTHVILMDEVRESVYRLLFEHPLYSSMVPGQSKQLSLLVIGAGKTGLEFLKAALWCGQMLRFDLMVHVIDVKGNLIYKKLLADCPEMKNYEGKIFIHKGNIFSYKAQELLDQCHELNYCVCALPTDDDNIRAALYLRRYFYREQRYCQPVVCACIESNLKRSSVWNMHEVMADKKPLYYNIIPFGTYGSYFDNQNESRFMIEYLGLGVQFYYCTGGETDSSQEDKMGFVNAYFQRQENRQSSIANGIHMKYKLWELGYGVLRVPETSDEEGARLVPAEYTPEIQQKLLPYHAVEHMRWMAFARGKGWSLAAADPDDRSLEGIRSYFEGYVDKFRNQNKFLRKHPALVESDPTDQSEATLAQVEKMMGDVRKDNGPGYQENDQKLVDNIWRIISGEWYDNKELYLMEWPMKRGSCRVYDLADLAEYYYSKYQKAETAESIQCCRRELENCCHGVLFGSDNARARRRANEILAELTAGDHNQYKEA